VKEPVVVGFSTAEAAAGNAAWDMLTVTMPLEEGTLWSVILGAEAYSAADATPESPLYFFG
jgi:hypothetical protein